MTPDEIVKALRREGWSYTNEAADLIERQATALEVAEKALVESRAKFIDAFGHGRDSEIISQIAYALATIRKALGENGS